jgi:hypothetical protein
MSAEAMPSRTGSAGARGLRTLHVLEELVDLVVAEPRLYVRWSRGPEVDLATTSKDDLTGAELPGLCANPLRIEPWWDPRPARVWVARRLYDYRHLAREEGVRPWILEGEEVGRGPDDEPIVECLRPVALLSARVIEEAESTVHAYSNDWGPLDRGRGRRGTDPDGTRG